MAPAPDCHPQEDHRFPVQRLAADVWRRALEANAAADYYMGYRSVVESFIRQNPDFLIFGKYLRGWPRPRLAEFVESRRGESLAFLVMMLTGECNADCTICFTDRRRKRGELTPDERDRVLQQAARLGARYVYVPGEGEPTIDRGFWQFLETCRDTGLEAVVFSNGLVFSDAATCRHYWRMEPVDAVAKLRDYPVSLYLKFWSTDAKLVAEMMSIRPHLYHFGDRGGVNIPASLALMMDEFPRERVGIEVVVERRNADEVVDAIVPFAEREGLARIIEIIQHNGRVFGDGSFDPTDDQVARVQPFLSPTSCSAAPCKAVVTSRGYLSPRIAILENQIEGTPVDVRTGELFDLLHSTAYVVENRYALSCLCEEVPARMAGAGQTIQTGPTSVIPPMLQSVAATSEDPGVR